MQFTAEPSRLLRLGFAQLQGGCHNLLLCFHFCTPNPSVVVPPCTTTRLAMPHARSRTRSDLVSPLILFSAVAPTRPRIRLNENRTALIPLVGEALSPTRTPLILETQHPKILETTARKQRKQSARTKHNTHRYNVVHPSRTTSTATKHLSLLYDLTKLHERSQEISSLGSNTQALFLSTLCWCDLGEAR